jgi:hypothetical protein
MQAARPRAPKHRRYTLHRFFRMVTAREHYHAMMDMRAYRKSVEAK